MAGCITKFVTDLAGERRDCLAVLGAITALYLALKAACSLWSGLKQFLLARSFGVNPRSLGAWAVVTGSTDGIGKAYAEALAKAGLNIVLISRTREKLNAVAKEIESKYKVSTKVVAVDFTGGTEIYSYIAQELAGLDIGVLVNNVGMSYDFPMFLTEAPEQDLKNVLNVNCTSVTFMSKIVLPGMVEKRKGAIINISSLSGVRKVPLLAVYSSTKAYVEMFSQCIAGEYSSKGIIVQCVAPGFVATKMSRIRNASLFVESPESFVRTALPTLGVTPATFGCVVHALQGALTRCVPDWLYLKISNSLMHAARAKGFKKRDKKE